MSGGPDGSGQVGGSVGAGPEKVPGEGALGVFDLLEVKETDLRREPKEVSAVVLVECVSGMWWLVRPQLVRERGGEGGIEAARLGGKVRS